MGLTDEQINAILGATESASMGSGLPFPLLKINYDSDLGKIGAYAYNPQKDDNNVVEKYDFVGVPVKVKLLKSIFQYSKFDTEQNKATITSNIFNLKDAKKSYDLKTGELISKLKLSDKDIKFQRIILGIIYIDNEEKPFIMYTKGAFLYDLNDILRKYPNEGHLTHIFELDVKKNKRGSVTYFTPVLKNVEELSQDKFIKNLKNDAGVISEFDKWVDNINNSASGNETAKKITKKVGDIEEDEDNISF